MSTGNGSAAERRSVVITGASAGVGRATARILGERGCRVGLIARGHEGLEAAAREVEESGGEPLILSADVADAEQVEEAAAHADREFGGIDVWINNAIATVFAPLHEIEPDEYRRVTEVSYLGTVYGTMAALRRMRPRDAGAIVQVGSALAYRGIPLQSAYCGAKHAIQGFTESLRCELMHEGSGIRLTMVQLPALNTPQFEHSRSRMPRHPQPVPPIYQPEVAADAIVWASEHDRRELFVGGPAVKTIWGNKIAPWLADIYLARTGFDSQQTDEPVPGDRPGNLFEPVGRDEGAHGPFDARSRDRSLQQLFARHRTAALAGGAIALGAAILLRP